MPESCGKCGKLQPELSTPLKHCAKCGTQKYCSRDCQKADWPVHKKTCARLASQRAAATGGTSDSLADPPKSEIERHATETIELLEALSTVPGFNGTDPPATTPKVLGYLVDFLVSTFKKYWIPLLQPVLYAELSTRIPVGEESPQARKEKLLEAFDGIERKSNGEFDRYRWPEFDKEKYQDALGRNVLARMIVTDDVKRRGMFPGMEPRGWGFGKEVRDVVKGMKEK